MLHLVSYKYYLCRTLTCLITYKQLGVIILLIALLLQLLNRVLIISDYYLNTQSYAAKCENKARPMLHCNGKCQMAKKLAKQEKKDQQNPESRGGNKNDFYFFNQYLVTLPLLASYREKQNFPLLPDPETINRPHSVFKPPAA